MNLRLYCLIGAWGLSAQAWRWRSSHWLWCNRSKCRKCRPGLTPITWRSILRGRRLFTTPQANKAVDVLDLKTGKVLHTIAGFGNPHAILYRADRNRLFVTDGGVGALRIFDATTYREIKSIKLELDADGIGYDEETGYLYVSNGGDAAGKEYSLISIIDTAREEKIGDIRVDAPGLEAMVIDHAAGRLYVNLPEENAIAVVDLQAKGGDSDVAAHQGQRATWPSRSMQEHKLSLRGLPRYGCARKHRRRRYGDGQRIGSPAHWRLGRFAVLRSGEGQNLCLNRCRRSLHIRAPGRWKLQGPRTGGYRGHGQDVSLFARS